MTKKRINEKNQEMLCLKYFDKYFLLETCSLRMFLKEIFIDFMIEFI